MKISTRIKTIADLIDDNNTVIDIGCDHGLLDIYLTNKYTNIKCIASDINKNALNNTIENIHKYKSINITPILSDGLENIKVEKDIIVISGMGYHTIKHILSNEKAKKAKQIIIQSNNDLYKLRAFMEKLGFNIEEEKVVKEKKNYYVIISFIKGSKKYCSIERYVGPKIIENKHLYQEYLKFLINKDELNLKQIPKKYICIRYQLKKRLKKIMEYII